MLDILSWQECATIGGSGCHFSSVSGKGRGRLYGKVKFSTLNAYSRQPRIPNWRVGWSEQHCAKQQELLSRGPSSSNSSILKAWTKYKKKCFPFFSYLFQIASYKYGKLYVFAGSIVPLSFVVPDKSIARMLSAYFILVGWPCSALRCGCIDRMWQPACLSCVCHNPSRRRRQCICYRPQTHSTFFAACVVRGNRGGK